MKKIVCCVNFVVSNLFPAVQWTIYNNGSYNDLNQTGKKKQLPEQNMA